MNYYRLAVVLTGFLLLASLGFSYQSYDPFEKTAENGSVVFISTQGGVLGGKDRVSAFNTSTAEAFWTHSKYGMYYDIDVVNDSAIFFVAKDSNTSFGSGSQTFGELMNWRTGEVYNRVDLPKDTHDADFIGDQKYLVADIEDKAYLYDDGEQRNVWEYNFSNHYPPYPDSGGIPVSSYEGWTHLNDADMAMNDSAILLSPRNFNRVVLINRSTKEPIFTLGSQNNTDVLHRQHNPSLISKDPFTVLVANSENNAVEEYRRTEDGWKLTWSYSEELSWPRDADRLPTGETLITDTHGQRVLQVEPSGEIDWEITVPKIPYDAETLKYGEEPQGPPITSNATAVNNRRKEEHRIGIMIWYMPVWFSKIDLLFSTLFLIAVAGLAKTQKPFNPFRELNKLNLRS